VAGQKPRKDWYSVSVDTLRLWGLLCAVVALPVLSYFGYRAWERQAKEHEAAQILAESQKLIEQLRNEKRAESFRGELNTAFQSYQQARAEYDARDYPAALESGRRSRNVLLSILEALELPGSTGQAQFISIQGDVELRRGDRGDWEEARSRMPLHSGDFVRTSGSGSAEIMFLDGTLYTVRPNTQFIVSPERAASGPSAQQSIQMEYGWVDLSTTQSGSQVRTPEAVAEVRQDSEGFVAFDKGSRRGRFGAFRGGIELSSKGGLKRSVGEMQQVTQSGEQLSEPQALPGRPEPVEPADNLDLNLDRQRRVVLAWNPVPGASRYSLQVSRNHLFVDNIVEDDDREKTRATLELRGEGTFEWRVAAYGPGGLGPWSPPRKFRVASFRAFGGGGGGGGGASGGGGAAGGGAEDKTPPRLDLDDVKSYGNIFMVVGRSEAGSHIDVNGEQVKVEADGSFTKAVQLNKEGWSLITVTARDSGGNQTVRRQRVFVESP